MTFDQNLTKKFDEMSEGKHVAGFKSERYFGLDVVRQIDPSRIWCRRPGGPWTLLPLTYSKEEETPLSAEQVGRMFHRDT